MQFTKRFFKRFSKEQQTPPPGLPVSEFEFDFISGRAPITLAHPMMVPIVNALANMIKDHEFKHYLAMTFWRKDVGPFEVIVQKADGKTTAQKNTELEKDISYLTGLFEKHPAGYSGLCCCSECLAKTEGE